MENASAAFLRRKKALSFNAFSSRAFSKLHRRVRQTFHVELIGEHVKQDERHRGDEIAREKSGIAARIGGQKFLFDGGGDRQFTCVGGNGDHGPDIVVPRPRKLHDGERRQNGHGQRQTNFRIAHEIPRAVYLRRFEDTLVKPLEKAAEQKYAEHRAARDDGQNQNEIGIRADQFFIEHEARHESHDGGQHHQPDHHGVQRVFEIEFHAGERIRRQGRHREHPERSRAADENGVENIDVQFLSGIKYVFEIERERGIPLGEIELRRALERAPHRHEKRIYHEAQQQEQNDVSEYLPPANFYFHCAFSPFFPILKERSVKIMMTTKRKVPIALAKPIRPD